MIWIIILLIAAFAVIFLAHLAEKYAGWGDRQ